MSYWICARTHPNSEKIAIRNLKNQDFGYYQPLILERKIRKNKVQMVETPLFPCYLFVRVIDHWRSLQSTYGVASVLSAGSFPAIVQDKIIQDLKARESNGFIQLPKDDRFGVGDVVQIKTGVFAGQQGLVERMSAKDRQEILLSLLGGGIKVLIPENDLELAA